ncbi:MAG: RNA polymerase sigma-70 factor [Bacteroidetes bacterium]|nr:RNA polymerase sigma-70 factor [Fibrella sp.]
MGLTFHTMRQTGTTRIELAVDPIPFQSMDAASADELAAPDNELFIRRAFEQDARLGCELLFRRYYDALCSHAVRFVSSKAIAEDLVAEIFCQFYAGQVFQTITISYRAYLYKTVRHRSYNYLRQMFRRDTGLEEAQYQGMTDAQQPDAITHYEELYQDVERAIQTLPVQRRRIYLMHRFDGKKYTEIADELGLSPRTVEVQIRRASHHLRDLLRDKWLVVILWSITRYLF